MPIEYMYRSHQSGSDKSHRPALRSRTQTFVDLSSRFSALPVTSSSFSSSTIYKHENAGRITTAYAITVTAINNGKDNYPQKRENKSVTYVTKTGNTTTAAVRVVTIKKPYVVDKPLPLTPVETQINAVEGLRKRSTHSKSSEKDSKSTGRSSRGSKTPTNNIIERAGKLDIVDLDGNQFPFRELYSSSSDFPFMETERHEKVMTIFIRPSFCCRQQLRRAFIKDFLSSLKSNSGLPSNTKLIIIWCGSHIRLRRLIQSTQCSFPIYADPNGLVYQLLEKTGRATDINSDSAWSKHAPGSATATLTNIVQSAKLIKEVNPLKHGGARPDIGTAFLFESGETVKMSWSYRIASASAQLEADVVRRVLGIKTSAEEKEAKSMASIRDSRRISRERTFESEKKNAERSLRTICGLPAVRYAHRRTVSCAEGFQTWLPRVSCITG
ncbi:hypothetical protein EYB25_002902 [Talaromyces marneffei]|nr:hypothetical protein EYB25_002902 [Talaromyces marneffei]